MDVKITFNDFTVTGANALNNVTIKLLKGEKGDPGEPTDAQVQTSVNTWLAAHPEATTTVQDGAISYAKLDSTLKAKADDVDDLKSSFDLDSLTPNVKSALLNLLQHVAYVDEDGQDYYDDLYDALYNRYWQVTNNLTYCTTSNASEQIIKSGAYSATITPMTGYVLSGGTINVTMGGVDVTASVYSNGVISIPSVTGALVITVTAAENTVSYITATYTQGNYTVFSDDTIENLKKRLVVTATFADASTSEVPENEYTLSGTLTGGTSVITVDYRGKTDTFNVDVDAYEIPDGYTAYGYIEKRSNSSSSLASGNFIKLNDQADLSVLSLEMKASRKSGYRSSASCLGVRNTSDWLTGYGLYFPNGSTADNEQFQASVRGASTNFAYTMPTTPVLIEVDNPEISPISIKIDGVQMGEIDWSTVSTPPVVPHGFWILGYGVSGTTSNTALQQAARIGYIKLRKADGECVGYYTPCVYNNLIGMYDQITKTFYTAATTSSATVGTGNYAVGNW